MVRVGRELAARDALAFRVAQEAVGDWLEERFPDMAELAGRSDEVATRPARMLIEAFSSASAVRAAASAGDDPDAIFNEQAAIAQEQSAGGTTKEWVVGFMQLRCIAIGYMLGSLGDEDATRQSGDLFRDFMGGTGSE